MMISIVSYVTALAIHFTLGSASFKSETASIFCPTPWGVAIATCHNLPETKADHE